MQFWIKTADRVWQTSLTEELKISVSPARNATDRCGKRQLFATMTAWTMGDNSLYSQTIDNMEPSNTFYAKNLLCLVVINKCYWKTIQSYWS